MPKYGLLVDYEFCSGCHTCEVACKMEHGFPEGKYGIRLADTAPIQIDAEKWYFDNIPIPTDLCDLCAVRAAKGQQPACVKHCQEGVMKYGTLEELVRFMGLKRKTVLFAPQ